MLCETELHYLRQISELIVMFLMPRCYSLSPVSHFMREVLACKVFQPAIDLITDPDYINQKIIQYLEAQKEVNAMHVRTHEYAKTFEDYIRLINSCDNVDQLKRLRSCLPLHKVLESVTGRRYLSMFLETMCSQGLVGFWMGVEELRHSPRSSWHQLGAEIFYTYIRSPTAEIKVDKDTRKRMEAFLLGDKGPEVFYEVQDTVVDTIQEKYYSSFMLSEQYKALMIELANEEANKEINAERSPIEDRQLSNESVSSAESAAALHLTEHSTYARRKLDQLQERHNNKTQPESRALAILDNELERLTEEQMWLESHLAHTDTWAEHLGTRRATVQSAEILTKISLPQFVIVVHMAEQETTSIEDERLRANLHGMGYIENAKIDFRSTSSEATNRSSTDREAFTHLSADEDEISLYLDGNGTDPANKNMANAMRGAGPLGEERDSIAEPLYALLSEVFDMRGVFRWLRKTLVTFVQITYGRTINRQIKETVTWLFSEQMLHYYISVVLKSWWPGGVLSEPGNRNMADREHTRTIALEQLSETVVDALSSLVGAHAAARGAHKLFHTLQNTKHNKQLAYLSETVVDALSSLVGAHAAVRGAHKLFHTLQNTKHNKQLAYELFELVLMEVFPELKRYHT
ncbi:sorting nexin-25-like [Leguminivora glycinivorella]|uniref:sorting nexin-25-like n=1 Tax=Leguminivora glycinivorella TaxID=1035111 RepID=UPI00200E1737|nr:sorting nexin-25-like [Leguminivora glycinivorella]